VRIPRTFLFVDLTGFTNYTASQGDEAAGQLLSSFRALTRRITSERGVRVAKWLGDGAMIVAIEQGDALATALDLEKAASKECTPLALRSGLASGHALLFEGDDYIGTAVNVAARLCDLAESHQVLVPADQLESLPEGIVAVPAGEHLLRGIPEPVAVVAISGAPNHLVNDTGEVWTRAPFMA
jgi:adenylate cyclase